MAPSQLLRGLSTPFAALVAVVVVAAWFFVWATSDLAMAVMGVPMGVPGPLDLALFFALLVVMMVAMMLPSALPMVLAFHGLTRLEGGRPTKPADRIGTVAFLVPYFAIWGAFAVAALLGLMALGLLEPMRAGPVLLVPAGTLVAAGLWQLTRTKEVCLSHCTSPMGFVLRHWRPGRLGAMRMGFRHSMYCIGCCWLFMVVLFVTGSMSLLWMGGLSLAIFAEKVGVRPRLVSRGIGGLLVLLGALFAVGAWLAA